MTVPLGQGSQYQCSSGEYSPTGEGVLPLLDGCCICSLCWDGGGRELMIDGNRKGYTPGV